MSSKIPAIGLVLAALALALAPGSAGAALPDKIVVVTVDGLPPGAERDRGRVPALAALADQGVRYTAAWSPSALAFPSIVALLTADDLERPEAVHDEATRGVARATPTLAERLHTRGYRGAGFPADPIEHALCGLAGGFEDYSVRSPALADSERADSALAWLARPGRRWAWLGFTLGSAGAPWRRMDGTGPVDSAAFDERLREIDRAIGRLVHGMGDPRGRLVVVAGTGWPPERMRAVQAGVWRDSFPVTLVMSRAFDGAAHRMLTDPCSLAWFSTTLIREAGVGAGPASSAGRTGRAARLPGDTEDWIRVMGPPGEPDRALERWRDLSDVLAVLAASPDSSALERLRRLADTTTDSPRITLEYALARSRFGSEGLPSRDLKSLVERRPDYPEAVMAYADHLLRHRRAPVAEAELGRIAPESPLGALAAWRGVVAVAAQKRFREAAFAAERAGRLSMPDPSAFGAADSLRRLDALSGTVKANPADASTRLVFADALARFGLLDLAYEQLHAARALTPGSGEADYRLALLLLEQDRLAPAIATLQRALATEPGLRPARVVLADALLQAGRRGEARHELETILSDDPRLPREQFNFACLLAAAGERDSALAALQRATQLGYDDWERLRSDPDLASLRGDPRYQALLSGKP